MKNNFLIYSIIFAFVFFILKIILNSYDLDFMYSIYQLSYFIIFITAVIGFFQITKNNKILLVLAIFVTLVISFILIIGTILSSRTVNIITIDGQKVVEEIYGIPDPMAYTYKYINPILKSYNTIQPPIKKLNSDSSRTENDIIMKFHNTTINTNTYHND